MQSVAFFALLVCFLSSTGCFGPKTVEVSEAVVRDMPLYVEGEANVTALNRKTVTPEVTGTVATYAVKVGDIVTEGQVLAVLDEAPILTQIATLEAQLAQPASYTDSAAGGVSGAELARAEALFREGIITKKELDGLTARAGGYGGRDTDGIRAALEQARRQLDGLRILSPMNGTVSAIYNEDRKVAIEGRPFMVVQQFSPVTATLGVPRESAVRLRAHVGVIGAALFVGDAVADGILTYVDPAGTAGAESVTLRATFDNADGRIKPGGFYRLAIEAPDSRATVSVPDASVRHDDGGAFVYVLTESGRIDVRTIVAGASRDGYTAVLAGVVAGESVVTSDGSFVLGEAVAKKR